MGVIRLLGHDKIEWPFESGPKVYMKSKFWNQAEEVDPFPGYHHDIDVVGETVELVEKAWPLPKPFSPIYFVLSHEMKARVQAATNRNFDYKHPVPQGEDRLADWESVIVFSGKRTPIHPAVTRYLVAHEYGHVVDYYIERMLDMKPDADLLDARYKKLRNLKGGKAYGAKNWDNNVGEIIANDFRILITGVEEDYWPHSVPRPIEGTKLHEWWLEMKELCCD